MPIKYVPYVPNTVEGQAVLDNISRTQRVLRYRDNDKVISKIMRGMPYYEVEKQEQVGEESENLVIRGECLSACAYLKEQGIKVDLVYIDPPFASGADYAKKVHIRRNPKLAEKIKKAEEELEIEELKAFEETMYGDIWQKEDYLNWMYENLMGIKSIMSESASIYVHLDSKIGHYVKILLDEVFGENCFKNNIVWCYFGFKRRTTKKFPQKHDDIFYYVKEDDDYVWNLQTRSHSQEYIDRFKTDENGRKYRDDVNPTGGGSRIIYLDESDGDIIESFWNDIPPVNPVANERQDYATQKPEALLKRIISASSNKEMTVVDFFGGSGVTAKVANDLGRKFIHVDVGLNSIQTTRDRLVEAGADFQILEIKDGVSLFRNPQQTMDKLAKLIPSLQQKVPGVGKFWFGALQDSKLGTVPVYVPNLI
ncbi:MAG: DNA methyltransferase, partial [Bacteroidota bacterium]